MHHKQWHLHPDALFVCVSSAKSSVSLFCTKIMQFTQIQILFKAITLFHSLHLQQDEVSLALHITSATIMKTHQHAKNLILQPLMLEPEEYRERFVINTWLQCSFYTLSWKKKILCALDPSAGHWQVPHVPRNFSGTEWRYLAVQEGGRLSLRLWAPKSQFKQAGSCTELTPYYMFKFLFQVFHNSSPVISPHLSSSHPSTLAPKTLTCSQRFQSGI